MPDDMKLPTDTKLSEADVKRVLERAVQIDGAQAGVTVSDLAEAAHEAGISQKAMLQAVQELLQDRELVAPADPVSTTTGKAPVRSGFWLRAAAFGFLVVVALMMFFVVARTVP